MKKANLIVSIIMTVIAIVIILISSTYPKAEAYGTGAPGPGLWPICISVVIILMSLILAIKALKSSDEDVESRIVFSINQLRVYLSMTVLLIYVFLLKPAGFILSTVPMVSFFIWWFSKEPDKNHVAKKPKTSFSKRMFEILNLTDGVRQSRPVWLCLLIAMVVSFTVYFVFKLGLKVPMNFGLFYI